MTVPSPAETDYRLSPEEVEFWHQNGFVGPYTAFTPDEMAERRDRLFHALRRPSTIYGFRTWRDRHLDIRTLYDIVAHPSIVDRVSSIFDESVLLWRTKIFRKQPGAGEIAWHQGGSFEGIRNIPALDPPVNITCWFAFTEATRANGCVQILRGTHKTVYEREQTEDGEGIFGRDVKLKDLDDSDPVYMEVQPGQFFLFNELAVHGSDPNTSDTERIGVAVRFTKPSTKVLYRQRIDGQGLHLKNWHAILVKGDDRYGHNRLGPPPESDDYPFGPVRELLGKMRFRWQNKIYGYEVGHCYRMLDLQRIRAAMDRAA